MSKLKGPISTSIMLCMLIFTTAHAPAQQPPPGTDTGQRIGTIIKTAIDTALPGVTAILTAIWGNRGNGDRINKQQLEQSVQTARDEIAKQFQAKALEKMQPVREVSDKLAILYKFMEPSTDANESIIRMQGLLIANPTISDQVKDELDSEWGLAAKAFQEIDKIPTSSLDTIKDSWLRDTLTNIKDLNKRMVGEVTKSIKNKDSAKLQDTLKDISLTLVQINKAARYQISYLQADTQGLAELAEGKAGPGEDPGLKGRQDIQSNVNKTLKPLAQKYPAQ